MTGPPQNLGFHPFPDPLGAIGGNHGAIGGNHGAIGGSHGAIGGNHGVIGGNHGVIGGNHGAIGGIKGIGPDRIVLSQDQQREFNKQVVQQWGQPMCDYLNSKK